jgi:hypothetical protein
MLDLDELKSDESAELVISCLATVPWFLFHLIVFV